MCKELTSTSETLIWIALPNSVVNSIIHSERPLSDQDPNVKLNAHSQQTLSERLVESNKVLLAASNEVSCDNSSSFPKSSGLSKGRLFL